MTISGAKDTLTCPDGSVWVRAELVQKMTRHTLDKNIADTIRKKFPPIAVNNETSPMQAGYQLGITAVLDHMVREGFLHIE